MQPHFEAPFTERDLLELADRIETHQTVMEKLACYQRLVKDPELAQIIAHCRRMFSLHAEGMESTMRLIQEQTDFNAYSEYDEARRSCLPEAGEG